MKRLQPLGLFVVGTAALLGMERSVWGAPNAQDHLRVIAVSGDPAAGLNADFRAYGAAYVNDRGDVSYTGFLAHGNGVSDLNDVVSWIEGPDGERMAVRKQDHPPGTQPGTAFDVISPLYLDAAGTGAFRASLVANAGGVNANNNTGIWSESGGGLQLVAREGAQAPGTPAGAAFGDFNLYVGLPVNRGGQAAFRGALQLGGGGVTAQNDSGVWAQRNGSLELVVRANDPAPGTPTGGLFDDFWEPDYNDLGQAAFRGTLKTGAGGVTFANDAGIWSEGNGSLQLLARSGAPAAGVGAAFIGLGLPVLNNQGDAAFSGSVRADDGGPSPYRTGIWTGNSTNLRLVALQGAPTPGVGSGAKFGEIYSLPALSDQGTTAFFAELETGSGGVSSFNDFGVWKDVAGDLQLVAREGDLAPGAPDGATFFDFANEPVINERGQIAFHATVRLLSGETRAGIWVQDRSHNLQLVALTESLLDVAEGSATDWRVIGAASLSATSSGAWGAFNGFNNEGYIAFTADFRDGTSAIVVSDIATLPEPASGVIGVLAAIGWAIGKRRLGGGNVSCAGPTC